MIRGGRWALALFLLASGWVLAQGWWNRSGEGRELVLVRGRDFYLAHEGTTSPRWLTLRLRWDGDSELDLGPATLARLGIPAAPRSRAARRPVGRLVYVALRADAIPPRQPPDSPAGPPGDSGRPVPLQGEDAPWFRAVDVDRHPAALRARQGSQAVIARARLTTSDQNGHRRGHLEILLPSRVHVPAGLHIGSTATIHWGRLYLPYLPAQDSRE